MAPNSMLGGRTSIRTSLASLPSAWAVMRLSASKIRCVSSCQVKRCSVEAGTDRMLIAAKDWELHAPKTPACTHVEGPPLVHQPLPQLEGPGLEQGSTPGVEYQDSRDSAGQWTQAIIFSNSRFPHALTSRVRRSCTSRFRSLRARDLSSSSRFDRSSFSCTAPTATVRKVHHPKNSQEGTLLRSGP
jgi:hypothetical protein